MNRIVFLEDMHPTNMFDLSKNILLDLNNLSKAGATIEEITKNKEKLKKFMDLTEWTIKRNLDALKKYKDYKIFIEGEKVEGPSNVIKSLIRITMSRLLGENIVEKYNTLHDKIWEYIKKTNELDKINVKKVGALKRVLKIAETEEKSLIITGAIHSLKYYIFLEKKNKTPKREALPIAIIKETAQCYVPIEKQIISLAEKYEIAKKNLNIFHQDYKEE